MAATPITNISTNTPHGPGVVHTTITIPDSAAVPTDGLDLAGSSLVGVYLPISTEGATLGFTVSNDDSTYVDMYDFTGAIIAITLGSSRYIPLDPAMFVGVRFIKPKTASNQTGAAALVMATRPVL